MCLYSYLYYVWHAVLLLNFTLTSCISSPPPSTFEISPTVDHNKCGYIRPPYPPILPGQNNKVDPCGQLSVSMSVVVHSRVVSVSLHWWDLVILRSCEIGDWWCIFLGLEWIEVSFQDLCNVYRKCWVKLSSFISRRRYIRVDFSLENG